VQKVEEELHTHITVGSQKGRWRKEARSRIFLQHRHIHAATPVGRVAKEKKTHSFWSVSLGGVRGKGKAGAREKRDVALRWLMVKVRED